MKNSFPNTWDVNIGGIRIKCIRFADDMALLAEDERMLKNILMELNDRCEDYGKKINIKMCMQYLLTSKKHFTDWIGRNSWGS